LSSILVVDVGNSRMKWGLARQHTWISQGVVPNTEIGTLALRNWQNLPRPARAVGVNVAGEAARVRVEGQLARWRVTMEWIILPGLRLMLDALAENTAALKVPPGQMREFPTSTPDALYSGAIRAVCGAIEQMRYALRRDDSGVICYLAGGAAPEIAPHLAGSVEVVDNLVLEGVLALALSAPHATATAHH